VAALLTALLGATYMTGVAWFVEVVHYPLFARVGPDAWADYHRRHSDRTTLVVAPGLLAELGGAAWVVLDRPAGVGAAAAWGALGLGVLAWAITGLAAVPAHRRLAGGWEPGPASALARANLARTLAWTAHAALATAMVAAAA
jgi:hypothetical protein